MQCFQDQAEKAYRVIKCSGKIFDSELYSVPNHADAVSICTSTVLLQLDVIIFAFFIFSCVDCALLSS
jgi:hypothetical protein